MNNISELILNFFNSNFFVGIVTLIVGLAAYRVYQRQKQDAKRDAANVVLLEIEGAEQQLQILNPSKDSDTLEENIYLMPNSSWEKYRHLFVRDFDRNEWDKITDFYKKCLEYDAAVTYQNNYFGSNVEKAQNHIMRVLANYAQKYVDEITGLEDKEVLDVIKQEYEEKKRIFLASFGVIKTDENFNAPYFYGPMKPVIDAKSVLGTMESNLSLSSVGIKLKQMASQPTRRQKILRWLLGAKTN